MPPQYVKPYVKTNKHDAADAEGCCEAVQRPSMRFVPVKSETQQALLMLHRIRDRLIAERTGTINAIRGHMAEFGIVAARQGSGDCCRGRVDEGAYADKPLLTSGVHDGANRAARDSYSDWRDAMVEASFHATYGSPLIQALLRPSRERRPATPSARPRARGDRVRTAADRGDRGADGSRRPA